MANAAGRLKIGLVLVKRLGQMVATGSGWVVASIVVLVLVKERAGWSYRVSAKHYDNVSRHNAVYSPSGASPPVSQAFLHSRAAASIMHFSITGYYLVLRKDEM